MKDIHETNKLSLDAILGVIEKRYAIVRVPNFYQEDVDNKITHDLLSDESKCSFRKANNVQRIGMPHFDIVDAKSFNEYHEQALNSIEYLREIYYPYLSPIDHFRLLLDELWLPGAKIETLYGKKCFVGLCRIIKAGSELFPHIDRLCRDSHDSFAAHSLLGQLAVNIFISVPNKGGEIQLWLNEPDLNTYEQKLKKTNSYHVDKSELGEPDVLIRPEVGDLIIFSSRNYHGVKESHGGYMASIATFVGYRGHHEPLSLWS